jgi:hypothetical protein
MCPCGIRAITVRRTLPHIDRTTVGPWVFLDHYGLTITPWMWVVIHTAVCPPSAWLFDGEIRHNDSAGYHETIKPGDVVMMTTGSGISHTEESVSNNLHGAQLWLVHPDSERHGPQNLQRYTPQAQHLGPATVLLFMGELGELEPSPIVAPLSAVGAEITIPAGRSVDIPLNPALEYAVLSDSESLQVNGNELPFGGLWYQDTGTDTLRLHAGDSAARLLLLGGLPFEEQIVMFWNFIGRSQDEVVQMRNDWEDPVRRQERFGYARGYQGKTPLIPAPALPTVTMRARGNK